MQQAQKVSDVIIIDRLLDVNNISLSNLVELYPNPIAAGTAIQVDTKLELNTYDGPTRALDVIYSTNA